MVVHTLSRMAAGGIRDHAGGGFHRYSVDARWLVPHFEKMLYDNALLARALTRAHLLGARHLGPVAEETLDYVLEDLTSPEGVFYSARDADSEGEEGVFYLWTTGRGGRRARQRRRAPGVPGLRRERGGELRGAATSSTCPTTSTRSPARRGLGATSWTGCCGARWPR